MSIIVKTIAGKMLQDTVVGVILQPHRPTLTENSSFIETRSVKNEFRGPEIDVLVTDFIPNDKITDVDLGADWAEYTKSLKKGQEGDANEFLATWVRQNGKIKKGTDKAEPEKPANGNKKSQAE